MGNITTDLLTITDSAKLLGICSQTLRNWEKREDFPLKTYYTLGGHRRYSRKEIETLMANGGKVGEVID